MKAFIFFGLLLMIGLNEHVHVNTTGENRVGKITIDDRTSGINQSTWIYVKNALDYYKKNPPIFLIMELNTPGGEVFAAQKISDALKNLDTQNDIPVVAYINNWAISAGAMLAYSSRYIAVAKDASMGAAEPVLQDATTGEMKTASEKVNSALRTDFANRAKFFGRNPYIAEAMVDKDLILVMRNKEIIKVDSEAQVKPDDIVISPKGKLLTLNAEELIQYGVANFALQPVKLKESLFQDPFFANIPNVVIDEYKMDTKTQFFAFLANPIVTSALTLILMLGIYMEFSHPGFGLPGIAALCSLFLLILSSYSLEIIDWFSSIHFEGDTHTFNAAGAAFFNRLGWFLATMLFGSICIAILAWYTMPHTLKKFVLKGNEQVGFQAGITDLPVIGTKGRAYSFLRPAGKVEVDGNLYDALSTGQFIEEEKQVVVVGHRESQLLVKEIL